MIYIFFCVVACDLHKDAAVGVLENSSDCDENVAWLEESSAAGAAAAHVDAFEAEFDCEGFAFASAEADVGVVGATLFAFGAVEHDVRHLLK